MTVTRLGEDDPATWAAAARLLDEYRQHYGANPAPEAAATWLREQIDAARARVYLGLTAGPADGVTVERLTADSVALDRLGAGHVPADRAADRPPADRIGAADVSVDGVCTVAVVPSTLTLRTVWLIRDLYVRPAARRRGVARALLEAVSDDAAASGAHRLSLQTESANTRAIELYARAGFTALPEVTVMDSTL